MFFDVSVPLTAFADMFTGGWQGKEKSAKQRKHFAVNCELLEFVYSL